MMQCDAIYEMYKYNTFSDKKFVSFHHLFQVHGFGNKNLPAAVQGTLATSIRYKRKRIEKKKQQMYGSMTKDLRPGSLS